MDSDILDKGYKYFVLIIMLVGACAGATIVGVIWFLTRI